MRLHDHLTRAAGIWPGRPDLTGRTPRNGRLSTEDVGCLDQDGSLFVTDKIAYLAEAENAPYLRDASRRPPWRGENDQHPGQLVHALIAPTAGERPDSAKIMALGQDHRVGYTCPRGAEIRGMLTMMGAGKIDTRLLLKSAPPHA